MERMLSTHVMCNHRLTTAWLNRVESTGIGAVEFFCAKQHFDYTNKSQIAELGHWYEPDKLMGYFVALYFGKLLVWDKVLGLGTTDPLAGFASVTSNLVVSFYFAKRGFENVARIIKR